MRPWTERHTEAVRHVEVGRRVILRQRLMIERYRSMGLSTVHAESLLDTFERTQVIFEDDLIRISREPH
jgi:hypothetical protein